MTKKWISLFIGGVLALDAIPAIGSEMCSDNSAGVSLNKLPLASVALSLRLKPNVTKETSKKHIGNAVFVREHGDWLDFLTAHHVVFQACKALKENAGSDLVVEYKADREEHSSHGFTLASERCDAVIAAGFKKSIDLGSFNVPRAAIKIGAVSLSHPLEYVPIIDTARTVISRGHYYGYLPFPDDYTNDTNLIGTKNEYVYAINDSLQDGWSGAPVFRKAPVGDWYFLAGVVISSPDLEYVYNHLSANEDEVMTDRRVGLICAEMAQRMIVKQRSLVVRLAVYQFDDWVEAPSKGIALLNKQLNKDSDLDFTDKRKFQAELEALSSIEQFDLTSHLLKLFKNQDPQLANKKGVLIALAGSIRQWCYANDTLLAKVENNLINTKMAFNPHQVIDILQLVGKTQKELGLVYSGVPGANKSVVFARANRVFSLLYANMNADRYQIRDEFQQAGISDRVLSFAVYDHARLKLTADSDEEGFRALSDFALALDESNLIAKWGLADNWGCPGRC